MTAAYASVVLDVDSTVSGVEGIDWLAERRGGHVRAQVVALTERAMRGEIALESIYGLRLAEIQPMLTDIQALSQAYIENVAVGCADAVHRFRKENVDVVLVSGGIRAAILPLASHLGIAPDAVNAVDIYFTPDGQYVGFDRSSSLTTSAGKRMVVDSLRLRRRILAVGDGATDIAMKGAVDAFAAFTGFVAREPVVAQADLVIESFAELAALVLEDRERR